MKKRVVLVLLTLTFLISSKASADIVPDNTHQVDRCVEIVNLDEFPDMYLIGYITGPVVKGHETRIIKKDKCLGTGYRLNRMQVLASKKSYIDSIGVNNIQVRKAPIAGACPGGCFAEEPSDKNVFISDEKIEPYSTFIREENPLVKETIEYSIAGFSGGKLILYKSKHISEYNNGASKKVEVFNKPQAEDRKPAS